jgi:hypothetical protein
MPRHWAREEAMAAQSIDRVLTRHFLRRFLENDLISPDADRAHLLAVVGAALFSTTIFVTMMMSSFKYVVGYYTPAQAAVASLDDKFFYIGLSMVTVALLAVAQWDALVVDARDSAILDPLPVRQVAISRAKLAAVAIFGGAAAGVVNLAPTVIFPLLLLVKQRIGLASALVIIVTHAVVTLGAAAFGYLCVVALRETAAALLGGRWFRIVSPWLQGSLIVALGTALLLLPAAATRVERNRLSNAAILYSPPAWFLGAYERLSGHILMDAPREQLPGRLLRADVPATAAYRRHQELFAQLSRRAAVALPSLALFAIAAYLLNARRRPASSWVATDGHRGWLRAGSRVAMLSTRSTVRAGFYFTLAALWRSSTHRLTIACCGAAGLAMSLVALSGLEIDQLSATRQAVPRLLIVQPLLMGLLLVGFRHAIRVPAELRANWGFQLAWRGHERQFVTGARRAAMLGLVTPALAAVFVLDTLVLGPSIAAQHAVLGAAGAFVLLEALMIGYDKVPFTCSYVPDENMKALGPIYLIMFVLGAVFFAQLESAALTAGSLGQPLIVLVLLFAALRAFTLSRHQLMPVDFDEAPTTTQKLGLNA